MAARGDKGSLKRAHASADQSPSMKKPRRSQRIAGQEDLSDEGSSSEDGDQVNFQADDRVDDRRSVPHRPQDHINIAQLPSPVTRKDTTNTSAGSGPGERSAKSPPQQSRLGQPTPESSPIAPSQLHSPPDDTQPFSQFIAPAPYSYEVKDEEEEGVWGYLVPLRGLPGSQETLVLKRRAACPLPDTGTTTDGCHQVSEKAFVQEEGCIEKAKLEKGVPAGGYLIGRHAECDRIINMPTVSNRHCLFFNENKLGDSVAVLEDLSGNGTFVNDGYVGRNKRRELQDGDEISILDVARFVFRYPRIRETSGFSQQYKIETALGKGHFATVYLCTDKSTGMRYAVKHFERRMKGSQNAAEEKSKVDGLEQEIGVLKGVSHPNMVCLKDTFNERDGVYMVLELAPEGELFNWIVMKQKLTESEARKVFVQLFEGIKYLHERNIVHRDIKPENILVMDRDLQIKLADFGLAKIIGEESFTATLCGTPSYVAPEILEQSNRRRYTRAVDVWSLGVVLYICLCGFPPFSDELYSQSNPYNLSQQIKMGRFDYPSPYWDSVGDPALDLIDRMLTVDVEKRITIDGCLQHPWTTGRVSGTAGQDGVVNPNTSIESTDGLTGALGNLDFSSRKVHRERTLLSSLNDVNITKVVNTSQKDTAVPAKVFKKNASKNKKAQNGQPQGIEPTPAHNRNVEEFARMGGKGDEPLFNNNNASIYQDQSMRGPSP